MSVSFRRGAAIAQLDHLLHTTEGNFVDRRSSVRAQPRGNVSDWTLSDVLDWLRALDLTLYAGAFQRSSVDGPVLLSLTKAEMIHLIGVRHPLHLRKLDLHLELLRSDRRRFQGHTKSSSGDLVHPSTMRILGHQVVDRIQAALVEGGNRLTADLHALAVTLPMLLDVVLSLSFPGTPPRGELAHEGERLVLERGVNGFVRFADVCDFVAGVCMLPAVEAPVPQQDFVGLSGSEPAASYVQSVMSQLATTSVTASPSAGDVHSSNAARYAVSDGVIESIECAAPASTSGTAPPPAGQPLHLVSGDAVDVRAGSFTLQAAAALSNRQGASSRAHGGYVRGTILRVRRSGSSDCDVYDILLSDGTVLKRVCPDDLRARMLPTGRGRRVEPACAPAVDLSPPTSCDGGGGSNAVQLGLASLRARSGAPPWHVSAANTSCPPASQPSGPSAGGPRSPLPCSHPSCATEQQLAEEAAVSTGIAQTSSGVSPNSDRAACDDDVPVSVVAQPLSDIVSLSVRDSGSSLPTASDDSECDNNEAECSLEESGTIRGLDMAGHPLTVGDRVEARYKGKGRTFYVGTITAVNVGAVSPAPASSGLQLFTVGGVKGVVPEATFTILYDDGDRERGAVSCSVRKIVLPGTPAAPPPEPASAAVDAPVTLAEGHQLHEDAEMPASDAAARTTPRSTAGIPAMSIDSATTAGDLPHDPSPPLQQNDTALPPQQRLASDFAAGASTDASIDSERGAESAVSQPFESSPAAEATAERCTSEVASGTSQEGDIAGDSGAVDDEHGNALVAPDASTSNDADECAAPASISDDSQVPLSPRASASAGGDLRDGDKNATAAAAASSDPNDGCDSEVCNDAAFADYDQSGSYTYVEEDEEASQSQGESGMGESAVLEVSAAASPTSSDGLGRECPADETDCVESPLPAIENAAFFDASAGDTSARDGLLAHDDEEDRASDTCSDGDVVDDVALSSDEPNAAPVAAALVACSAVAPTVDAGGEPPQAGTGSDGRPVGVGNESPADVPRPAFGVGDRVQARYKGRGSTWYPGTVSAVHNYAVTATVSSGVASAVVTFAIQYDDGDAESSALAENMRPFASSPLPLAGDSDAPSVPVGNSTSNTDAVLLPTAAHLTSAHRLPSFRDQLGNVLSVGDRVEARYKGRGTRFYPGEIVGTAEGDDGRAVFSLSYDDGDSEEGALGRNIRLLRHAGPEPSMGAGVALLPMAVPSVAVQGASDDASESYPRAESVHVSPVPSSIAPVAPRLMRLPSSDADSDLSSPTTSASSSDDDSSGSVSLVSSDDAGGGIPLPRRPRATLLPDYSSSKSSGSGDSRADSRSSSDADVKRQSERAPGAVTPVDALLFGDGDSSEGMVVGRRPRSSGGTGGIGRAGGGSSSAPFFDAAPAEPLRPGTAVRVLEPSGAWAPASVTRTAADGVVSVRYQDGRYGFGVPRERIKLA